jgi:hypothetical protein
MRKFQIAAALAFGVMLFAGAPRAHAQATNAMTVTVSFPFMVGTVMMPPGSYEIVPDSMDPYALEIRNETVRMSAFAAVLAPETTMRRGEAQFQFVNVGGRYYLTKIDDGTGDVSELAVPDSVLRAIHAADRTQVQK